MRLAETVNQAQLPPFVIELELTEGVLMQDAEAGRRSLQALKEFGFSLASTTSARVLFVELPQAISGWIR